MRLAWREENGIARTHFRRAPVIAHFSPARGDNIKLRFLAVPVIRTTAVPLGNSDLCEIKRMAFGEIERVLFAPERDRDVFDEFVEYTLGRLAFVFREIVEIDFAHGNQMAHTTRKGNPPGWLTSSALWLRPSGIYRCFGSPTHAAYSPHR